MLSKHIKRPPALWQRAVLVGLEAGEEAESASHGLELLLGGGSGDQVGLVKRDDGRSESGEDASPLRGRGHAVSIIRSTAASSTTGKAAA